MKNVKVLKVGENSYELVINDDVEVIEWEKTERGRIINELEELRGKLKVKGGKNLKTTEFLLYECIFDEVDLSEFVSDNVEKMEGMFFHSQIGKVVMPKNGLGSDKLRTTQHMFCGSEIGEIDLSKMNMGAVENICCMFVKFRTNVLDLRNWDLKNVKHSLMFLCDYKIKEVLLGDSVKSLKMSV